MAFLDKVFKAAMDSKASDIHVVPGEPFMFRRMGRIIKIKSQVLSADAARKIIREILSEEQRQELDNNLQLDFAYSVPDLGRFRGNAMMHNNGLSAVFRAIPIEIPTLAELGLPDIIHRILDNHQGLILVTGSTGHGKTTTLAAMIDLINSTKAHHILTVEDPIEFIHPLKKGVINQRQRGSDTLSYANALKGALRQDPDVIIIGELRDLETISLAISASETGHLVVGTLSTSSAPKTVDRIIDSYPPGEQNQIRAMLSESLKAVITQRLIPGIENDRMELAVEILIGTLAIGNLIRDGKTFQMESMMQMGKKIGMRLMDESILELFLQKKISLESALRNVEKKSLFKQYMPKPEVGEGSSGTKS